MSLGDVVAILVSGFVVGALGRLAVPGRDPMPIWMTILLGIVGSIVGGAVALSLGFLEVGYSAGRARARGE